MTFRTDRKAAEDYAILLSAISHGPPNVWLVVDTGSISTPEYRVWREHTIQHCNPESLPDFELCSRADNGRLEIIA